MARSVRDELLTALDDLEEDSFVRFRCKIRDWDIKAGYTKIPKSKLEKAKAGEVVDLIRQYYTDSYGAELTVDVLNFINEKAVALALEKALENVKGFTWSKKPKEEPQSTSEASCSSAPKPQVVPFVDKHQESLIARCAHVSPILDGLKTKGLITDEQYDAIRAERTPQEKMRALYMFIREFSESDKHTLYEILKKNNSALVKDLEKS